MIESMSSAAPSHERATPVEELANALTHGFGTLLAIAALVLMVVFAAMKGSARTVVSVSLFGSALAMLYLFSTLYHALKPGKAKQVFRVLDHAAIYLLIAGTYTPFCLVTLRGGWGWSMFGVVWGIAALGITMKAVFGLKWEKLSLALYLAMGWAILIAAWPLAQALPRPGLLWLLAGGLCYTGGSIFYAWHRLPLHHAWWHLCVVGGSACHVVAVMGWVIPK